MRILFPIDTQTRYPTNPYLMQLIESLNNKNDVARVSFGAQLFFWPKPDWDVIHFQWPEALFGWKLPTKNELAHAKERLREHKNKNTLIVTTVHNYEPKAALGEIGREVFHLIHSNTDIFVHLGGRSKSAFMERYGASTWCMRARHVVIEHGDYSHYTNFEEDQTLIKSARRSPATRLIVVFGGLRSVEEEAIARESFLQASLSRTKLVFAGAASNQELPSGTLTKWKRDKSPGIVRYHHRIPDQQVAPLIKAARFVFVPREGRLNSGVVPLAFTFGTPVIGPSEGVIGDVLTATGNLTYKPGSVDSAADALQRGHTMSIGTYRSLRRGILEYRNTVMNWSHIAQLHLNAYHGTSVSSQESPSVAPADLNRPLLSRLLESFGKRNA